MITFTIDVTDGVAVVCVSGRLDADSPASVVVDRLVERRGYCPAIIDLSGATPMTGEAIRDLVLQLENAHGHHSTSLVHPDPTTRRLLRSLTQRLPVLPSIETALSTRPASPSGLPATGAPASPARVVGLAGR